ncbi:hypothetical protein WJX81_002516 [Elliptochloris bilobata]|uniref:Thioredoxin domain-containing protein n=1 Tax=Elliptochloris bilobata TaxID=381761 RepID=A0AAW1QX49_9CHLO
MWRLAPLCIACLALAAASVDKSNGFNSKIDWLLPADLAAVTTSDKPVMYLFSQPWCGACKRLKADFEANSDSLVPISKEFLMVNVHGDDNKMFGADYAPDGGYIPRIMFADWTGRLTPEIKNPGASPQYGYFYQSCAEIKAGMEAALKQFAFMKSQAMAKAAIEADQTPVKDAILRQTGFSSNRLQIAGQITRGSNVECQVAGGTVWEGVFHSATQTEKAASIKLNFARIVKGPGPVAAAAPVPLKEIADVVSIKAAADDSNGSSTTVFGTDAEIGKRGGTGRFRELQRWQPEPGSAPEELLEAGSDAFSRKGGRHSGNTGWDQFAVNQAKFQVRSTYNEDLYTIKLDKSKSRITVDEANRLAAEIEAAARSGRTSNHHVMEERGIEVDGADELDEEARYSGVARGGDGARVGRSVSEDAARDAETFGGGGGAHAGPGVLGLRLQQGLQGLSLKPREAEVGGLADAAFSSEDGASEAGTSQSGTVRGEENGGAAPAPWSAAGAGVAAVSGRAPSGAAWEGPGQVRTAPMEVDAAARREHKKVRAQLAGAKPKDRSSPYGTPKGLRSPLASPLVTDPQQMDALNLQLGVPRVDSFVRKDFEAWKAQKAAEGGGPARTRSAGLRPTSAEALGSSAKEGGEAGVAAAAEPDKAGEKTKTALNPFAKEFSFNPNAKAFCPGSAGGEGGLPPGWVPPQFLAGQQMMHAVMPGSPQQQQHIMMMAGPRGPYGPPPVAPIIMTHGGLPYQMMVGPAPPGMPPNAPRPMRGA